jgi:hypothetical protein
MSRYRAFQKWSQQGGEPCVDDPQSSALTASVCQEKIYVRLTRIKGNSVLDDRDGGI